MNMLKVSSICKYCGSELDSTVAVNSIIRCSSCEMQQTIYTTDSYEYMRKHTEASKLFHNYYFDRANGIFQELLTVTPDNAELNWNICLCRYGISYVDDKKTGKKIPTCHRTLRQSIFEDPYYLSALKNADSVSKEIYQIDAAYIDNVQRKIRKLVNAEESYDIFICYKESDLFGGRTPDSIYAQKIYEKLTSMGYKVFYAEITLKEEKVGEMYEPIIYSALSTAKVMLLITTKPEYLEYPWVRNEWSRFIDMMKQRHINKHILGCYMNMKPQEDFPKEIRNINTLDISIEKWENELYNSIRTIIPKKIGEHGKENINAQRLADEQLCLENADKLLSEEEYYLAQLEYKRAIKLNLNSARGYLGTALSSNKLKSIYTKNPQKSIDIVVRRLEEMTENNLDLFHRLKEDNKLVISCFGSYMEKALECADNETSAEIHKELSLLSDSVYKVYFAILLKKVDEYKVKHDYSSAIRILEIMKDDTGAYELYRECCYGYGMKLKGTSSGEAAADYFDKADGFKDSVKCAADIRAAIKSAKIREQKAKDCPVLLEKLKQKYKEPDPNQNKLFADFVSKKEKLINCKIRRNTVFWRIMIFAAYFLFAFACKQSGYNPEKELTENSVVGNFLVVSFFTGIIAPAPFAMIFPHVMATMLNTVLGTLVVFGTYFGVYYLKGDFEKLMCDGSLYNNFFIYILLLMLSFVLFGILPSIGNVRKVREYTRIKQEYTDVYEKISSNAMDEMKKFAKEYLYDFQHDREYNEMKKIVAVYSPEEIIQNKENGKYAKKK